MNHGDEEAYTGLRDLVVDGINGLRAEQGLDPYSINLSFNTITDETVCLLSKLHEAKHHVSVKLDMDEMDLLF